jgi:hypothetical protein
MEVKMANANNNPCADFAQSKFHLELSNFFEHIKKAYPNEQERVNDLTEKFKLFTDKSLIDIDTLDALNENLAKARSLAVVALSYVDFAELDAKTINDYLWTLDDLVSNAQNIIAQNE